eukprot:1151306-Pelagomonas_calceolata.AAC.1
MAGWTDICVRVRGEGERKEGCADVRTNTSSFVPPTSPFHSSSMPPSCWLTLLLGPGQRSVQASWLVFLGHAQGAHHANLRRLTFIDCVWQIQEANICGLHLAIVKTEQSEEL